MKGYHYTPVKRVIIYLWVKSASLGCLFIGAKTGVCLVSLVQPNSI